ncbi:hypothetical protein IFO69_18640 [Echinicola sp. CAU 1574]|uniref:Uncharacterized protein n=1 Tax=Echinicola arenosa TaxID=2774144 RepID=A0ABR9AQY3_9BACT|nr:hypothetical protein [Echinicola arenosa]MBD8490776.1 hypothetical protein [Echinicola arenosa]
MAKLLEIWLNTIEGNGGKKASQLLDCSKLQKAFLIIRHDASNDKSFA